MVYLQELNPILQPICWYKEGCHGFHACDHENQVHGKNYQLNLLNQNMNDAEKSDGSKKNSGLSQKP